MFKFIKLLQHKQMLIFIKTKEIWTMAKFKFVKNIILLGKKMKQMTGTLVGECKYYIFLYITAKE